MNAGRPLLHPRPESGRIVADELGGDPTVLLTPQESVFVQIYSESRNHFAAYRAAYPTDAASNSTAYRRACEVLRRPHVIAAVGVMRDQMNADTLVRATDMLRDLVDIANANPNELIKLERHNCRHCHGTDHGWQWRDAKELARALDHHLHIVAVWEAASGAERKKLKLVKPGAMSSAVGGFGFEPRRDPSPECPHCMGEGFVRVAPCDTTKLSPQALKLLKGVKQKADGSIEILMHDQMQARDMIIKMLGAYKDPKQAAPPTPGGSLEPIDKDATPEDAQRAYLTLIKN